MSLESNVRILDLELPEAMDKWVAHASDTGLHSDITRSGASYANMV